ncbi:MAG: hypothetical protein HKN04_08750 [Rhodothermaceae bacterium]|nr:hypothetical protein [Rhodothermaceae bacterium]
MIGAFDFAAVRVIANDDERDLRIAGRFHALEEPDGSDGGGGNNNYLPIAADQTCPEFYDSIGAGQWVGLANEMNMGGPAIVVSQPVGWQIQLPNRCNENFKPVTVTLGAPMHSLRPGIYRMVNPLSGRPGLGPFEVTGSMQNPYNSPYYLTYGYVWITRVDQGRADGQYSGYAVSHPQFGGPSINTREQFSAAGGGVTDFELPDGIELTEGVELPPGVELPTGGGN